MPSADKRVWLNRHLSWEKRASFLWPFEAETGSSSKLKWLLQAIKYHPVTYSSLKAMMINRLLSQQTIPPRETHKQATQACYFDGAAVALLQKLLISGDELALKFGQALLATGAKLKQ